MYDEIETDVDIWKLFLRTVCCNVERTSSEVVRVLAWSVRTVAVSTLQFSGCMRNMITLLKVSLLHEDSESYIDGWFK